MDHRRMLDWADGHLQRLKTAVKGFHLKEVYDLVSQNDNVTGDVSVRVRVIHPLPEDWVLMIGETLHNLRVPLDYLTFAIAERVAPAFAAADPLKIAFPICEDPKDWPGREGKLRQWASTQVIGGIEGLQPYHRRHAPRPEPLLVLDKLEGPHKHRRLLAAGSAVTAARMTLGVDGGPAPNISVTSALVGPFEDGAEMFSYRFTGPSQPGAQMKLNVTFGVAFTQQGPARGAEVIETLEGIRDHIRDVVFPKLEPFLI